MALNKIIYQDSNEALMQSVRDHGGAMTTLINTEFGVKQAASDLISRDIVEMHRPESDREFLIHLIAMGSSDAYGFNKNADWFSGDVLDKYHPTFVKYGHAYREHRNKDPETQGIGFVKHSAYDPSLHGMQRVELLVALDKDKAPEEYAMAKKGEELCFSMSCRVPNDRCSICGNEAKQMSHYCSHLKRDLGQYLPEFKKYAFAYNDKPKFFDISRVKNPADRIARQIQYVFQGCEDQEGLNKAASEGQLFIPSVLAAQYEGFTGNESLNYSDLSTLVKLEEAEKVACCIEPGQNYTDARSYAFSNVYPNVLTETFTKDELDKVRSLRPETFFYEMAKKACLLSFPAFTQYLLGEVEAPEYNVVKKAAAFMLPDIMQTVLGGECDCNKCQAFGAESEFMRSNTPAHEDTVQDVMDTVEEKFSVKPDKATRRANTTIIIIKSASDRMRDTDFEKIANTGNNEDAYALANAYAHYQIRAVSDIQEFSSQQFTNDLYDLVVGANNTRVYI